MNDNLQKKPIFWPMMFIGAFVCGTVLWGLWMVKVIRQTRQQRDEVSYFNPATVTPSPAEQSTKPAAPIPASPSNTTPAPTNGMVRLTGGTFWMGSDNGRADERPVHQVTLDAFWIDKYLVSNEQFEKFVKATGYVTIAERKPNAKDFPGADPALLVPGAAVFTPPTEKVALDDATAWWRYVPGANWRHPDGPASSIAGREKYPVVQVAWDDAEAYAKWAGKRLLTEAEFEYAARGGLDRQPFTWGSEQKPKGKWLANIWQGEFPNQNVDEDGFSGLAPVGSFPPNGFGLYDMAGNVWEWCSDWYRADYYTQSPAKNPHGPGDSFDPDEPAAQKRVQRGGSFLCNDVYCSGYKPGSRMKCTPDTGLSNAGFRCAWSE